MQQIGPLTVKKPGFNRSALKYTALMIAILGILLCLRWVWSQTFYTLEAPRPVDGVLDMRGVDLENSPPFFLNGQWLFYPDQLLSHADLESGDKPSRTIEVPGDWKETLGSDLSYGYGTYRLRILIDPLRKPVAMWIKNIEASSDVEINGLSEGSIGNPAASAGEYKPRNISYTSSYTIAGTTELDVLIRVANYDEPFYGGIVRSIRFGSQAAIDQVRWTSIGSQLVTIMILFLHGLYAFILFLFNRRERALPTMALLTVSVGLALLSGQDNLLQTVIPIPYTGLLRIRLISLLWQNLFMIALFRRLISAPPRNAFLRAYGALLAVLTGILLVAPASWANAFVDFSVFIGIYSIPFFWLFYIVGQMIVNRRNDKDVAFLLLTAAGIISNLTWSVFESDIDVTTVYYPIDLLITMAGFSTYWFKKYFRQANQNSVLNDQLKKADKLKDQFLANTSHELRTPLHGIMNIAQNVVAKEKTRLEEGSLKNMELLITISRRMSHMLGDLLDVARLQESRIVLQQEPLHAQAIAPGVIGMLQFMIQGKGVRLDTNIPETLPPVLADEKRLVQILYNLLHNAIKYTEEGTISVTAELRNGRAVIHVADTGVGMDEQTQARIFLPYEQGAYGINDGRGIGLGLSICKQLVELHGGTLRVRSAPGQGSVFSFDLPLADSRSVHASSAPLTPQRLSDETEGRFAGLTMPDIAHNEAAAALPIPPLLNDKELYILAVDDDPVNLSVLVGILEQEPYRIATVQSAREALDLLGTRPWDLLIADVMMPQMSGYELTQKVRERYSMSELPVLLLTARSQPADIYTGFLSGASDYVTKPVDALELKYRIRALTSLKQSINERLRMEAAYLQAQIHPHFLFNTLNSIMALSEIDTEEMRRLGTAFASFLRISFDFLNTGELVELSHELDLVQAYLQIEKARFEERLKIAWEVEPGLDPLVPPLSIQPLVENAVKHGALGRNIGGTVRVRIVRLENSVRVEVADDGQGMEQEQIDLLLNSSLHDKGGIGIANTHRRLIQQFGQGLSILSLPGQGTTVSFVIPDERAETRAPAPRARRE
ncbi:ATP-binding protein [Cohnella cellulosilytica]|uniref:histidine kinase n=1 Tax=Cohnella cellulosilytica TaxID=986710 RepID=A0ABW2FF87_9BACL